MSMGDTLNGSTENLVKTMVEEALKKDRDEWLVDQYMKEFDERIFSSLLSKSASDLADDIEELESDLDYFKDKVGEFEIELEMKEKELKKAQFEHDRWTKMATDYLAKLKGVEAKVKTYEAHMNKLVQLQSILSNTNYGDKEKIKRTQVLALKMLNELQD